MTTDEKRYYLKIHERHYVGNPWSDQSSYSRSLDIRQIQFLDEATRDRASLILEKMRCIQLSSFRREAEKDLRKEMAAAGRTDARLWSLVTNARSGWDICLVCVQPVGETQDRGPLTLSTGLDHGIDLANRDEFPDEMVEDRYQVVQIFDQVIARIVARFVELVRTHEVERYEVLVPHSHYRLRPIKPIEKEESSG